MICRSCTPLTHDTYIWFPADCRMSWTLCSEVKVQVYCVHLFCGKRIVVIVAWLLILFIVIRLLPLVLFPRGPSSILVLLNVIPSVNPSPHSPRRPHWSVAEYYEGGAVCAEQWSRQVITRRANQGLMKRENIPSPKRHSNSHSGRFTDARAANKHRPGTTSLLLSIKAKVSSYVVIASNWLGQQLERSSPVTKGWTHLPSGSHNSSLYFISLSLPTWK